MGMNETDYTRLTNEYPMAMLKALQDGGVAAAPLAPLDSPSGSSGSAVCTRI